MFKNILIVFGFIQGFTSYCQLSNDVNQYMAYQPFVNFASASSYDNIGGAIYYRNQWVGFPGAPENIGFQVATPLNKIKSHLGLRLTRDKIGVRKSDELTLNYAYRIKLTPSSYLSFSLSPQLRIFQALKSDLIYNDELDPLLASNYRSIIAPNFEFGSYYFTDQFYVGVVLPRILKNDLLDVDNTIDNTFDFRGVSWLLHSGYQFNVNTSQSINISTLVKGSGGAGIHAEFNAMYFILNQKAGFGLSYRTSKDIVALLNLGITKKLRIGYAFQYNFSALSNLQSGSHEALLILDIPNNKELIKINVPRF